MRKWFWLLLGALVAAGIVACGQGSPSLSTETGSSPCPEVPTTEAIAPTATLEPTSVFRPKPSPSGLAPREEATPARQGTPTPSWTVVPVSATQAIQEGLGAVGPIVPTLSSPTVENLVLQAKEDLVQRLSTQVDQIELVEVAAVVWPDGGLGCPQPGVVYTQVPRDGLLIRLRVGKRTYQYHSGGGRSPFLCERAAVEDGLVTPPGLEDR